MGEPGAAGGEPQGAGATAEDAGGGAAPPLPGEQLAGWRVPTPAMRPHRGGGAGDGGGGAALLPLHLQLRALCHLAALRQGRVSAGEETPPLSPPLTSSLFRSQF